MGFASEVNAFFENVRALLRVVSPILPADRRPQSAQNQRPATSTDDNDAFMASQNNHLAKDSI
jgi:hypothetical protein